jgi:hypothetical protein
LRFEASLGKGKAWRSYLKNKPKQKDLGGVAQVVQHLPSKVRPEFNPLYFRGSSGGVTPLSYHPNTLFPQS